MPSSRTTISVRWRRAFRARGCMLSRMGGISFQLRAPAISLPRLPASWKATESARRSVPDFFDHRLPAGRDARTGCWPIRASCPHFLPGWDRAAGFAFGDKTDVATSNHRLSGGAAGRNSDAKACREPGYALQRQDGVAAACCDGSADPPKGMVGMDPSGDWIRHGRRRTDEFRIWRTRIAGAPAGPASEASTMISRRTTAVGRRHRWHLRGR